MLGSSALPDAMLSWSHARQKIISVCKQTNKQVKRYASTLVLIVLIENKKNRLCIFILRENHMQMYILSLCNVLRKKRYTTDLNAGVFAN